MRALEHITILDLTHMLSGPYATQLLADMGAKTIKVEPPNTGEATRRLLAESRQYSSQGMGAYFLTLCRNKKSIAIDLKSEEGLAVFYRLVAEADVVVNNFGEGVPTRLGIDFERLTQHNPNIVTCSITGFGETGPDRSRPAFDLVAQGVGGGMSITGEEESPPTRSGIPIGDLGGGLFAAIGILGALNARTVTGKGQHVDISMQDCQVSMLNYMATMYLMSGDQPPAVGNGHFVHVPYGTFNTTTRHIIVACMGDAFYLKLAALLDDPALLTPAFATQPERWKQRHFINACVQKHLEENSCEYWLDILREHRIPAAPVNDFEHALNDPQIRFRNMVVPVDIGQGAYVNQPGNPIKFSDTYEDVYTSPPTLGEHTDEVMFDYLHYEQGYVRELKSKGVLG